MRYLRKPDTTSGAALVAPEATLTTPKPKVLPATLKCRIPQSRTKDKGDVDARYSIGTSVQSTKRFLKLNRFDAVTVARMMIPTVEFLWPQLKVTTDRKYDCQARHGAVARPVSFDLAAELRVS